MMTDNGITQPRVELIYDQDCPNLDDCRAAVRTALLETGALDSWHEWDRNDEGTPSAYRAFGSPTVLVNGRDINRAMDGSLDAECIDNTPDGNSCRIYADADNGRLCGVPSVQCIVKAIAEADSVSAVIAPDELCATAPSIRLGRVDACC